MLEGVNDSDAHARELVALVRDVPCKFNLIPFNPFPGPTLRRLGAGAHPGVRADADRCRHRRHDAQDARR